MELFSRKPYDWNSANSGRKRVSSNMAESDRDQDIVASGKQGEEHKVVIKLSQLGASFREWNLILFTKAIIWLEKSKVLG